MQKPNYEEVSERLLASSKNLLENHQIGNSKIILAVSDLISVLAWSTQIQEEQSQSVVDLTAEVTDLKNNLKIYSNEAKKSSRRMLYITLAMGVVAFFQLVIGYWQFRLSESQIEEAYQQSVGQDGALFYQQIHDDRIEARDNAWRREDLEYAGRLAPLGATSTIIEK
jgi:sensor histidine kinase YesM